jgi:hypothetical protein
VVAILACVAGSERLVGVPEEVLAAFRLAGAVPVLKPADSVREGSWFAEVYDSLTGPGFRAPRPVRALTGDWVALGWTAYRWLPGAAAEWRGASVTRAPCSARVPARSLDSFGGLHSEHAGAGNPPAA